MSYRILKIIQYYHDFSLTLIINTETNEPQIKMIEKALEQDKDNDIEFNQYVKSKQVKRLVKESKAISKIFDLHMLADRVQIFVIDSSMHKFVYDQSDSLCDFFALNIDYGKGIDVKCLFEGDPQENIDYRVIYKI